MDKNKSLQDLQRIREVMEQSSRFLSLSGLSGIFPGVIALLASVYAYFFILPAPGVSAAAYEGAAKPKMDVGLHLLIVAGIVLVLSFIFAWYFSWKKARNSNSKMWTAAFKRWLFHLLLPLFIGGCFTALLIVHHNITLVASSLLVFYGIALISAGKFTFSEIHYLGICEIVLGLLAGVFIGQGLLFWALGFGVLHILYGAIMYVRHK